MAAAPGSGKQSRERRNSAHKRKRSNHHVPVPETGTTDGGGKTSLANEISHVCGLRCAPRSHNASNSSGGQEELLFLILILTLCTRRPRITPDHCRTPGDQQPFALFSTYG
ncbi:hypothetical protein AOLI_G00314440 [Acnodon oligacanthus]